MCCNIFINRVMVRHFKQGQKRSLDTLKRMIERERERERKVEGEIESERERHRERE